LLPEKIVSVKPAFISMRNPKKKENLKFLFLIPIFLYLIVSPGAAASGSWELIPEHPTVGDTIEIKGTGFEGESAEVMVTFEKDVQVSDGKYEYLLEDVKIPSGLKNGFTVQATGADNLNVRAKMLLWITKSAEAKDGVAVVSQTSVPAGTYKIRIDGKSSASDVKLKVTALQHVEVDSEGKLSYTYNTKSMPAGNFEVKVNGIAKQIDLQPGEDSSSGGASSSGQISTKETAKETIDGIIEETSKEKLSGNAEEKGIFSEDEESNGNSPNLKSRMIGIIGVLAVFILFVGYLRKKNS